MSPRTKFTGLVRNIPCDNIVAYPKLSAAFSNENVFLLLVLFAFARLAISTLAHFPVYDRRTPKNGNLSIELGPGRYQIQVNLPSSDLLISLTSRFGGFIFDWIISKIRAWIGFGGSGRSIAIPWRASGRLDMVSVSAAARD